MKWACWKYRRSYLGWLWCLLTGFLPIPAAASICLFKPPYAIGSVRSLSGHVIACRWRSLPRVCRHRARSLQGRSSNGCCFCITTNQLMCASLFPRPLLIVYWYILIVCMLNVSEAYGTFIMALWVDSYFRRVLHDEYNICAARVTAHTYGRINRVHQYVCLFASWWARRAILATRTNRILAVSAAA